MLDWKSASFEAVRRDVALWELNIEKAPSSPSLPYPLWAAAQARIDAVLGCCRLRDSRRCLETLICTCHRCPVALTEPGHTGDRKSPWRPFTAWAVVVGGLAVEGRLGTHARPDLVVWCLCPGHIGWRFSVRATCREGCPAGDGGEADSIVHVEAHRFSGTCAACLPRTPRMDESVPARWGLSR